MKKSNGFLTGTTAVFMLLFGSLTLTEPLQTIIEKQMEVANLPSPELTLFMAQSTLIMTAVLTLAFLILWNKISKAVTNTLFY
ncbi:hypothetical protein HNP99_002834 [Flavobacterium sp. 28A]|uniref:hypothetical protein n=1 Tax=Flavobacterium sp. 28A TaxID=2735895 RepID=UPI001570C68F|nr:hypothetical protein [Flavobacterium sp. 28A]NRT16467.1 hypothetical protein [Flavobacterium sp. 28A]